MTGLGIKDRIIPGIEYYKIDIKNYSELEELFKRNKFDAVYHLASITFHDDIVNKKCECLNISLKGTENLIILFNKYCNNAKFVYSSTGKVYGKQLKDELNEQMCPRPYNLLGKSKYMTERLIDYYAFDNLENDYFIFRIFNVYGYGQRDSFVIPHIVKHIKEKKEIPLGNLGDYRDYLYVDDLVECFASVLKSNMPKQKKNPLIYNAGFGSAYCVKDILGIFEKLIGTKIRTRIEPQKLRTDEGNVEYSNCDKAKNDFNWTAKTTLEEGLQKILKKEGLIK